MPLLSDKLRSLGVKIGARDLAPSRQRNVHAIEQVVAGRFEETAYGPAFVVEDRYPIDLQHGGCSLGLTGSLHAVGEWASTPGLAETPCDAFAFLDTETTGLAGGTGTYVFMVGVGRYAGQSFHLAQFFMRDPAEEPALLAALTRFLEPCQVLVTFNGKAFDVPLLNTRYITTGFAASADDSPLAPRAHLDLLPLARLLWRDRLASRALSSLEQHILEVARTQEDVPGWLIPELYFEYLRSGDARPLKSVFYHNAMDVLSLAALLNHVASLLDDPLSSDSLHELDLLGIGKLFERLGRVELAVQLYERALAYDLPESLRLRTMQHVSLIQKREGDLPSAVALWRDAAADGEIYAHVELAKFYEHTRRDYQEAARWTQEAIHLLDVLGGSPLARDRWLGELEHRMARLQRKMDR
jgi:uncharacterized protein YprB with RNaseH-like and TPR domain